MSQLETARRVEHHVGNYSGGEVLAGDITVAGVVAVDEEASVGQADLVDYASREQAASKHSWFMGR